MKSRIGLIVVMFFALLTMAITIGPNGAASASEGVNFLLVISGGDNGNHKRYWNDVKLIVDTLIPMKGFGGGWTYVLYWNGTGKDTSIPVDYAATKANLKAVFTKIAGFMDKNDSLYIFTTDHGNLKNGESYLCLHGNEEISATEFAGEDYLGQITKYKLQVIVMFQCHSGGFVAKLKSTKRIVYTAVRYDETSWTTDGQDATANWKAWINLTGAQDEKLGEYEEFLYHFLSALKGTNPHGKKVSGDGWGTTNRGNGVKDGKVSLEEVFWYSYWNDSQQFKHKVKIKGIECTLGGETPQRCDPGNHGTTLILEPGL